MLLCQKFVLHVFNSCRISSRGNDHKITHMKKLIALSTLFAISISLTPSNAFGKSLTTVTGPQGQVLNVSNAQPRSGTFVTVNGNKFDESVGLYLAFCVVPKKGSLPTPCGGGVNKEGVSESSIWISSNPPPYAQGLTKAFLPNGSFSEQVLISRKIGKFDCTKVKCAITVRADHLKGADRSYDLYLPIKIKSVKKSK